MRILGLAGAALLFFFTFMTGAAAAQNDETIPYVTSDTFVHNVIASPKPVIVQFVASWCPYCKKYRPIIEAFAAKYAESIDFYSVDVDKEGDLMIRMGVRTLPTTVIFYKGKEISRRAGVVYEDDLGEWVAGEIGKLAAPQQSPRAL